MWDECKGLCVGVHWGGHCQNDFAFLLPRGLLKKGIFAPYGMKFFLFGVDLFSEGN